MLSKYWPVVFLQPLGWFPAAKGFNVFNSKACLLMAFKHLSPQIPGMHGYPSVISLIWSNSTSINEQKKGTEEAETTFPRNIQQVWSIWSPQHNHIKLVGYICAWHIRAGFEIALALLEYIQSRKKPVQSPFLQKRQSNICLFKWPTHTNEQCTQNLLTEWLDPIFEAVFFTT